MKDYPILFSGAMVQAILEGRKTQTRRVLNRDKLYNGYAFDDPRIARSCPYGQAGDRLWVRETWLQRPDPDPGLGGVEIMYRATDSVDSEIYGGWRPSIFMPRWASRITLEILGVRVEPVQNISKADAIAEGLCSWVSRTEGIVYWGIKHADVWEVDPRATYTRLWDSINAKRGYSWAVNPWVWCIEFKRV